MTASGIVILLAAWAGASFIAWLVAPGRDASEQRARRREELSSARRRERVRVEDGRAD